MSAPAASAVLHAPVDVDEPGRVELDARRGRPASAGRTVSVTQFSLSATALTGARKAAHSLGCCSNAGGVVCSS